MMVPTSSTPVGTSYFSICSRRIEAISFGWSLNSLLRWSPGGHCVATGAGPRGGRARTGRPCGRARARSRRPGCEASTERSSVTSWPLASASLARICSASASAIGTAVVSSSSSCRRARRSASCTTSTTSASASRRLVVDEHEQRVAHERIGALAHLRAGSASWRRRGNAGLNSTPESSRLPATAVGRRRRGRARPRAGGPRPAPPRPAPCRRPVLPAACAIGATPLRAARSRPRPAPLRPGAVPRPRRARGRRPSRSRAA